MTASGGPFRGKSREFLKHVKLEDALKQNPYDKTRGSKGAYIRYLRYTVDGWYSKKSEEIRKQIDWDKITKER